MEGGGRWKDKEVEKIRGTLESDGRELRRNGGRRRRVKNSRVGSRGPLTEIVQKSLSKLP
jgi:hypothetical protein